MAVNTEHVNRLADQIRNTSDCDAIRVVVDEHIKSLRGLITSTVRTQADQAAKLLPILSLPGPNPIKIVKWVKKLVVGQIVPQLSAYVGYAQDLIKLAAAVANLADAISDVGPRLQECAIQAKEDAVEAATNAISDEISLALDDTLTQINDVQNIVTDILQVANTNIIDTSSVDAFISTATVGLQNIQDTAQSALRSGPLTLETSPELSGSLIQGEQIEATNGVWTGADTITYTYQWMRVINGTSATIDDANEQTYTPTVYDIGSSLKCKIVAESPGDAEETVSNTFGPVIAPAAPLI